MPALTLPVTLARRILEKELENGASSDDYRRVKAAYKAAGLPAEAVAEAARAIGTWEALYLAENAGAPCVAP